MPSQRLVTIPDSRSPVRLILVLFLASFPLNVFAAAPDWLQTMEQNCNKGMLQDCLNAGWAYKTGEFKGKKAIKDPSKAKIYINDGLQLAQKNCNKGNTRDCYTIGLMYFEGGLIPTDVPKGLNYLQRSCKGGYKEACDWLDNSGLQGMIR
ncbi:tetratricopeptide repeat protein [Kaarinaea lacus]